MDMTNIKPDDKIVMAKQTILPLKFPVTQYNKGPKPRGLWYAIGTSWIDWVRNEMPDWEGNHIYNLQVNANRILIIKTYEELLEFSKRYTKKDDSYNVFWSDVSKSYDGIEINPYQPDARFNNETAWYYGWDVASGCIWNENALNTINKISKNKI